MTEVSAVHRIVHRQRLVQLIGRSVAHDLRNVAQALQMSVDVLRGIPDADVSVPTLVDEASYRLLDTADRLGQWVSSRPRMVQVAALQPLLATLGDLMHNHPGRDRLVLDMTVPADFPLVNVVADEVVEVAWELMTNAVNAAPAGTTVRVTMSGAVDGDNARLVVEDDGPGIPADVMPALFRLIDTEPGEVPRLGLAVVRSLLHAQGGDIVLEPTPVGARFVCTLPLWRRA